MTEIRKIKKTIELTSGVHRNNDVVFIAFDKDSELIGRVKQLGYTRWSQTKKVWYCLSKDFNLKVFFTAMSPFAYIDYSSFKGRSNFLGNDEAQKEKAIIKQKSQIETLAPLQEEKLEEIKKFERYLEQKRYGVSTIKSYSDGLRVFFRYFSVKNFNEINNDDLIDFNRDYILAQGFSSSYQNQIINAIKLFYKQRFRCEFNVMDVERPKMAKPLPKVIAKEDVESMLKSIPNLKHKMALATIYGLGLRRAELIYLKVNDIDMLRDVVCIRNSKGKKDRMLPLGITLKKLIVKYIEVYKPETYFIEGAERGNRYSYTSIENIFHKYMDNVLKDHNFTLHCLRHSYATHILDAGTDIRFIQELLGHKSSKTTEIYTHVSMRSLGKIKNPTDDFDI